MFSTDDAHKLRMYVRSKRGDLKKYGRVRAVVFHPTKPLVVGYVIKRPDALLMVKRRDRFVAFDRIRQVEGGICADERDDTWDSAACKRLGIDYEKCVIWENMPVRTDRGRELGTVSSITFDEGTQLVDHIDISANAVDKAILGSADIPVSCIQGYRDGAIVVDEASAETEEAGGAAAQAGVAWAKTKHAAETATKKAGDAINDGAYKAGELIGSVREKASKAAEEHEAKKDAAKKRGEYTGVDKAANLFGQQLGKASGMFKEFKEELDKASRGE